MCYAQFDVNSASSANSTHLASNSSSLRIGSDDINGVVGVSAHDIRRALKRVNTRMLWDQTE